jgi:hypothetical protein
MPQFPDWKGHVGTWSDAVQQRRTDFGDTLSDLAERGREATDSLTTKTASIAQSSRERAVQLPRTVLDEVRRRVKILDFATKSDLEAEGRLARTRVSVVLHEFLNAQQRRDTEVIENLRSELREELQSFAAAIDDGMFAPDAIPEMSPDVAASRTDDEFAWLDDDEDDDLDLGDEILIDDVTDVLEGNG